MKKTLVLASLLAAFGAASAQSSVTLYGWVDASLNSTTTGLGAAKLTQLGLDSGNVNGSRIGFRGTEALGNGLTANFVIETGFNVDTGSTSAAAACNNANQTGTATAPCAVGSNLTQYIGNRQTFVSLSSAAAGTLALGRQYSTYDSARGGMSPMGHTSYDSTAAWGNGRAYTFRVNNALRYDSATYSGFSFGATYGLGEDKTATASASNITSFGVGYAAGPVAARLAVQTERATGSAYLNLGGGVGVPAGATKETHTLLAGSYNFGIAKLTAEYNTSSDNVVGSTKEKEMNFGVNIPFGAASVDLGYGTSKQVGSHKATAVGVHVNYSLSPRTHAYVGLLSHKVNSNPLMGASVATAKTSKFGVGVRHAF
jgi:predicted porin